MLIAGAFLLLGCTTGGPDPVALSTGSMQCSSSASAMVLQSQLQGFPKYVELATSGSSDRDQLNGTGSLKKISFTSRPIVDSCQVLRSQTPYDNPNVDIYRKKNHVELSFSDTTGHTSEQDHRWYGGLIVKVTYLWYLNEPALGIEEVDPDGTLTRRLLYLDGRRRALVYHHGEFPDPPSEDQVPVPQSPHSARVSLV